MTLAQANGLPKAIEIARAFASRDRRKRGATKRNLGPQRSAVSLRYLPPVRLFAAHLGAAWPTNPK
jgi:hypothetical protein